MIKKGEVPEFGGFVREPKKRRDSRKRKSIEEAAEVPKVNFVNPRILMGCTDPPMTGCRKLLPSVISRSRSAI